jgi:hypothetical protein
MSGKDIRRKGHVFRGCCPIGLNAGRGGHEGHEDKSFKQELTEETEANPKDSLPASSLSLCCLPFLLFNPSVSVSFRLRRAYGAQIP